MGFASKYIEKTEKSNFNLGPSNCKARVSFNQDCKSEMADNFGIILAAADSSLTAL